MMSPEELKAIAYGVAKIAALCGALGAVAVQLALVAIRGFSDWFLAREQAARRVAASRARAASAPASEEATGRWGGACDPQAPRRALSVTTLTA